MADGKTFSWCRELLTDHEIQRIEKVVVEAEMQTSAEIVPMLVKQSTSLEWQWPLLTLLIAYLASAADVYAPIELWMPVILNASVTAAVLLVAELVLAGLLAWLFLKSKTVRRAFIPRAMAEKAVWDRALREFYLSRIQDTQGKTGVLIFISALEKRAVVLADHAISSRLPKDYWQQMISDLIQAKREKKLAQGLERLILRCAEALKKDFPRQHLDVDELSNLLIVRD